MAWSLRPLRDADAEAVEALATRSFDELGRAAGREDEPGPADPAAGVARMRHLIASDPEGAWGAEREGALIGAALALRRGSLWVLSLLAVDPPHQNSGAGRALLEATLDYARPSRGALIAASDDPRAIGLYGRAGFRPLPTLFARGAVDRTALPSGREVRDGDESDLELASGVDEAVRGAARPQDLELLLAGPGRRLLIVDRGPARGYAVTGPDGVRVLGATDARTARALLWAALAHADNETMLFWITHAQPWAFEVALAARLALAPAGPLMVRGRIGPFAPFLPNGALL